MLRTRVDRLERRFPAPPPPPVEDPADRRRWRAVAKRFGDLLEVAVPLMSEDERQRFEQAVDAAPNVEGGPLGRWLLDLRTGRCRLPQLSAPAMKDLLLGWLHPEVGQPMVCNQCGLEYPRLRQAAAGEPSLLATPRPPLFAACTGCGASRYDAGWPHQSPDNRLPWKALDGWMGTPRERR